MMRIFGLPAAFVAAVQRRPRRTALTALLVIKWLCYQSQTGWSLSTTATMLGLNLFTYRDLMEWLKDPVLTQPVVPKVEQMELPL